MMQPAKVREQRREQIGALCRQLFLSVQMVGMCEDWCSTANSYNFLCNFKS